MIAAPVSRPLPRLAEPAAVVTPASRLQVDARVDLDLPPLDRVAFDALLEQRPEVGVFASIAWLSGHFDEPPAGAALSLLLFREGTTLCGALPIAVISAWGHVRVTLVGSGDGSDRIDLIAMRGAEAGCADAFLTWLAVMFGDTGFVLELRNVPADSPLWGAVHRATASGRARLTLALREVQPLPYLRLRGELPEHRYAPAIAVSSGTDPLDRHRRWLARRGSVRVDMLQDAHEAVEAFDVLVGFLQHRWANHGGSALAADGPRRFHRRAIPRLLAEGRLRMLRLSVGDRVVGVQYGFGVGEWWGAYQCGYDRPWSGRIHLGRILFATAIEQAARDGAAEFDFLKGAEPVKYLWPVRERTTLDADIVSHHVAPQLLRAARAARDTAAAIVTSARGWRARSPGRRL